MNYRFCLINTPWMVAFIDSNYADIDDSWFQIGEYRTLRIQTAL